MGLRLRMGPSRGGSTAATLGARSLYLSYPWRRLAIGAVAVLLVAVVACGVGSVYVPPQATAQILLSKLPFVEFDADWPSSWETIVWQIRFPRIVLAGLVGASLAISGATYQGLFRNPLADPYLIGVSAGAGLAYTVVVLTSIPLESYGLSVGPVAAFAGGVLAVGLAHTVARRAGGLPLSTLILAGVAIGYLASAVTSLLMIRSEPDLRPLMSWLLGGFIGARWDDVFVVLPYLVPGALAIMVYGRVLNMFQLKEEEAQQLGVNVERTKIVLIGLATLVTAAAVSVSGLIGFVGLIAPHAVRIVWGQDNRFLLPMAMLVGAGFLVLADLVARTAISPSELPVGVVTAFCGAPFFLYLLRRRREGVL